MVHVRLHSYIYYSKTKYLSDTQDVTDIALRHSSNLGIVQLHSNSVTFDWGDLLPDFRLLMP